MNQIISQEAVAEGIKSLHGLADLAKEGTTTLVDETLKLYLFYGIVGILKASVVFIIFGIVVKFLSTAEKASDTPNQNIKAAKITALVISLIYFTINSMPHIMDIGKILVAPNLFIAEKGVELLKKGDK